MKIYTYDGTFEGFLTAVFECYRLSDSPLDICSRFGEQHYLFVDTLYIETNPVKAERVWAGIQKRMSARNNQLLFYAFLSEAQGIEMMIFRFLQRLFSGQVNLETDFGDVDVLSITQMAKKVTKEAERIRQFVRFQRTKDGIHFCGIEPRYDVLPLVLNHYQKRFADQKWLIYDLKRKYGVFYDKEKAEEVVLSKKEFNNLSSILKKSNLIGFDHLIFYCRLFGKKVISN